MQRLANRPFADIAVDENFVVTHTLSIADVERLAGAAAAFDVDATALGLSTSNSFMDAAARLSWAPMWLAGVVSARFPGVGVLPIGAKVETLSAPTPGEPMTLALRVREKRDEGRRLTVEARATDARGNLAMTASLELVAPLERASFTAPTTNWRRMSGARGGFGCWIWPVACRCCAPRWFIRSTTPRYRAPPRRIRKG